MRIIRDSVVWLPTALAGTARYRPAPPYRHARHRLIFAGDGFPGQHRFIKPGFTLGYLAVNRNAVAGGQAQRHARLNLGQRDIFLAVVCDHAPSAALNRAVFPAL
jgi:hypothetical protein